MPELPEIETIKNSMQILKQVKVCELQIMRDDMIKNSQFCKQDLIGLKVEEISRRGKYLIFNFGPQLNLIVHLGMSGRVYLMNSKDPIADLHVHAIIHLENEKKIIYQDPRRFGGIWFIRDLNEFFAKLGIEPLSEEFNRVYLEQITRGRKIAVKSLILQQNLISGIGNIYADEALFEAKIKPDRPAQSLNRQELETLCKAIKFILNKSIEYRGTTFRDYRDGFNEPGRFQLQLKVYGKINAGCPDCGEILKRQKIGGRSSFYCSNCQK